MSRTADQYRVELHQLLPDGEALDGPQIDQLLDALSQELARFDARMAALLTESDPTKTFELLTEWQGCFGLPDTCTTPSIDLVQERIALLQRVVSLGGQSIAYFVGLAATLGYAVQIDEFTPMRAGFRSGTRCADIDWAYAWRMRVLSSADADFSAGVPGLTRFRAGSARSGDRLSTFGATDLECVIRRAAPAHTTVIFAYPGA